MGDEKLIKLEPPKPPTLTERMDRLEALVCRIGHQLGIPTKIFKEYGLERWEPGAKDMRKWRG